MSTKENRTMANRSTAPALQVPSLTTDAEYAAALDRWQQICAEERALDDRIFELRKRAAELTRAERGEGEDTRQAREAAVDPRTEAARSYLRGETPDWPADDPRKQLGEALAQREIVAEARRIRTHELQDARAAASATVRDQVRPHWQAAVARIYAAAAELNTALAEEQAIRRALDQKNIKRLQNDICDLPFVDVYDFYGSSVPPKFGQWARENNLVGDK